MKKIFLLFLLSVGFISAHAQSLKFLYEGEVLGDTLWVDITDYDYENGDKWNSYFYFRNDGGQDSVNLKFSQKTLRLLSGDKVQWCASPAMGGECIDGDGESTPFTIHGDTVNNAINFHITCTPNAAHNSIIVKYTLQEVNNASNNASVIVIFKDQDSTIGIRNTAVKATDISIDVYPNPANATLNVRYTLPKSQKDATFLLRNMIGGVVKEIPISTAAQGLKVENLPNGVYFYSLVLNGQTVITKKLVIKH